MTFDRTGRAASVSIGDRPGRYSSLSDMEAYNDLMNYDSGTSLFGYLNNSTGMIQLTQYYSSTSGGAVEGYVHKYQVQEGQTGTPIDQVAYTYTSNIAGGVTVYVPTTMVQYPTTSSTPTITTTYTPTWSSGTNILATLTTTLPAVSTGQNGVNSTPTTIETYDSLGRLISLTDERGIVNNYTYSRLGLISQKVLNYQSGVTLPGVNVTTDFTYDSQGRLTQILGSSHTVVLSGTATAVRPAMWRVYNQSVQPTSAPWATDAIWMGSGYFDGTNYFLVDPVLIKNIDKDGRITDVITSKRSTGSGSLSSSDTFVQSDWKSWSSTQYASTTTSTTSAHQALSQRTYFLIPTTTGDTGTVGVNYSETIYGYDQLERRNRVKVSGGTATGTSTVYTITRTLWTAPQRAASVWVGTNDNGATDSDPTGGGATGNNMVIVTENVYDDGNAVQDGNLTQQTDYVSSTSGDTRVTGFGYDFRDRQTSMTDALGAYTVYTYDNLDRLTETQRYSAATSGTLFAQSATNNDDRGRVFQQLVYAVDPTTGTPGNILTANMWYDYSGNLLQAIQAGDGIVFTKSIYNGVGWVTATYRGYNTSGTSYSQANTVSGDVIMSQTLNTYDEAGNLISRATFDRLNDAPATGSGSTGALSVGTNPKGRASYVASWFDGVDRNIASADYGAATSFSRNNTPPTSSSSSVLVTFTSYDNDGRPTETTDANGIVTQILYDAANRKIQVIEDYATSGTHLNRTTQWSYTLDDLVATLTAVNGTTGDQTTTYDYGTTLTSSGVARTICFRASPILIRSVDQTSSVMHITGWANNEPLLISEERSARFITTPLAARPTIA